MRALSLTGPFDLSSISSLADKETAASQARHRRKPIHEHRAKTDRSLRPLIGSLPVSRNFNSSAFVLTPGGSGVFSRRWRIVAVLFNEVFEFDLEVVFPFQIMGDSVQLCSQAGDV
jgi:hypothetical protein